jgi:hypothetical protein
MSVTTTADSLIEEARDCIKKASNNIFQILNEDVWGASDYSDEYKQKLIEALNSLMQTNTKI